MSDTETKMTVKECFCFKWECNTTRFTFRKMDLVATNTKKKGRNSREKGLLRNFLD